MNDYQQRLCYLLVKYFKWVLPLAGTRATNWRSASGLLEDKIKVLAQNMTCEEENAFRKMISERINKI